MNISDLKKKKKKSVFGSNLVWNSGLEDFWIIMKIIGLDEWKRISEDWVVKAFYYFITARN